MFSFSARAVLALLALPALASSDPKPQNCGKAQNFVLGVGASVDFADVPLGAASCTISATTSPTGSLCLFPSGLDLKLCFGTTCHNEGDTSPKISGWQKPEGENTLTVTNLHMSQCSVTVQNFAYCCAMSGQSLEVKRLESDGVDVANAEVVV
mmetsp:Transcript_150973/g.383817  ORF Transcript_150973/g.383817 Transcript_150973/m.383817 type:complete len:153 (+) Transcript_150973:140-598(+)